MLHVKTTCGMTLGNNTERREGVGWSRLRMDRREDKGGRNTTWLRDVDKASQNSSS
jgi:hypothetical protein